ncbi:MAG: hypothetical protein WCJ64_11405 [Rhodospirillaceae bacterium]
MAGDQSAPCIRTQPIALPSVQYGGIVNIYNEETGATDSVNKLTGEVIDDDYIDYVVEFIKTICPDAYDEISVDGETVDRFITAQMGAVPMLGYVKAATSVGQTGVMDRTSLRRLSQEQKEDILYHACKDQKRWLLAAINVERNSDLYKHEDDYVPQHRWWTWDKHVGKYRFGPKIASKDHVWPEEHGVELYDNLYDILLAIDVFQARVRAKDYDRALRPAEFQEWVNRLQCSRAT